jgi:DNA-binding protein YbaB
MSAPPNVRVEDLLQEYERQRSAVTDVQRRLREVCATAVSPRHEVSVTVGGHGSVREIKFPTSAYKRMAPQDLAAVLMATVAAAQEQAADQAANIVAPMMPSGIDTRAVLSGKARFTDVLPAEPRMNPLIREQLDRRG